MFQSSALIVEGGFVWKIGFGWYSGGSKYTVIEISQYLLK